MSFLYVSEFAQEARIMFLDLKRQQFVKGKPRVQVVLSAAMAHTIHSNLVQPEAVYLLKWATFLIMGWTGNILLNNGSLQGAHYIGSQMINTIDTRYNC